MRQQTTEQVRKTMQQLAGIIEEVESQRLRKEPGAAPLSQQNLSRWNNQNFVYGHDDAGADLALSDGFDDEDDVTVRRAPSMQVSTLQSSTTSLSQSYNTACEEVILSSHNSIMPVSMKVFVTFHRNFSPISLLVDPANTIEVFKHDVCETVGLPCSMLSLYLADKRCLPDAETVLDCGIRPLAHLRLSNYQGRGTVCCSICKAKVVFNQELVLMREKLDDLRTALGASHMNGNKHWLWTYNIRWTDPTTKSELFIYIVRGVVTVYGSLPPDVVKTAQTGRPLFSSELSDPEHIVLGSYLAGIFRTITISLRAKWWLLSKSISFFKSFQVVADNFLFEAQKRDVRGLATFRWCEGHPCITELDLLTSGRADVYRRSDKRKPLNIWANVTLGSGPHGRNL